MSSYLFGPGESLSNLERFVRHVTPDVPSRTLPQSCFIDLNSQWLPPSMDTIEYFTLKDLWDCYYEWSAYGACTPVMLKSNDTIKQYYVPYLSAIQIYTRKSVAASREDSDRIECECDSSSDDSGSDYLSRSSSNSSSKAWDAVSLDSSSDQVGSCPTRDMLGYLYLEYTETFEPIRRVPFTVKINELARSHPALMTLKSVDLSPASWMAVAWYPIYSIPCPLPQKDQAAFLTYHTLSSCFQGILIHIRSTFPIIYWEKLALSSFLLSVGADCAKEYNDINMGKNINCYGWGFIPGDKCKKKKSDCISLSPFGLVTYKMQSDRWLNPSNDDDDERVYDDERVSNLYSAADSWLKQLNVYHHDFNFFTKIPSKLFFVHR
ncbi:uncharacterized protein LOC133312297 [Gastrolobium bilobum]|uniref:uncharacterized protein LOC133312297 n=1 Tax=Gastrolobium bilobum TaxID=150636 RepID=UPI002AB233D4|nr:uncharacterized protein LOC133312297 [Gastrolobium bilobum]